MTTTSEKPTAESPADMPPARGRWTRWLVLIYVVTLLAGILFGYDQGVIAGAPHGMSDEFDLGSTMKEVITSW
jgi:hypothetical protein